MTDYSAAYLTLEAKALAGEQLTPDDVEDAVENDPALKAACAELVQEVRHGRDVTVVQLAARLGMPPAFAAAVVASAITGRALVLRKTAVH